MRAIEYLSAENETVRGALYEPPLGERHPCILFTHGFLSSHLEWGNYPEWLCERGIVALAIDLRGHGTSDGQRGYITPPRGIQDIRAGIDFVASLTSVDSTRIGLAGHSLGAALSVCATAEDPRVKALVAIAPPASIRHELKPGEATVYAIAGWLGNIYKSFTHRSLYFPYRVGINQIFHHESARQAARSKDFLQHTAPHDTAGALVNELDTLACAPAVLVPSLVMHGEHDQVVSSSRLVYERLAGPKEFERVNDSGHSIMLDGRGDQAFEVLAKWLSKNL